MTPAAIIALIRDVAIASALGFILWSLVHYGEDIVKIRELPALQRQLEANAAAEADWQKQRETADEQRSKDIASIGARIDNNHQPVIVRVPANPGAVPVAAGAPGSCPAAAGPADNGSGIDRRPAVNQFEHKYESALIECRNALAQWPTN